MYVPAIQREERLRERYASCCDKCKVFIRHSGHESASGLILPPVYNSKSTAKLNQPLNYIFLPMARNAEKNIHLPTHSLSLRINNA
jgi:hypothetical protein